MHQKLKCFSDQRPCLHNVLVMCAIPDAIHAPRSGVRGHLWELWC